MLRLENISVSFGEKRVLRGFSFDFEKGRLYAVTGGSGVGKTTLLNVICGLVTPDGGRVVKDENLRIRAVFQDDRLLPWRTVLQNAVLRDGDEEDAKELLNALGLGAELGSYPDSLSGGMRRRTAIARALCARPGLLLLDEPSNGLDAEIKKKTAELIRERMRGGTVITATHDPDLVEGLADEIIELKSADGE